jgi:hypothetical protein
VIPAGVTVPCPAKNSGWHGVWRSGVHVENTGNVARIAVYGRQNGLRSLERHVRMDVSACAMFSAANRRA